MFEKIVCSLIFFSSKSLGWFVCLFNIKALSNTYKQVVFLFVFKKQWIFHFSVPFKSFGVNTKHPKTKCPRTNHPKHNTRKQNTQDFKMSNVTKINKSPNNKMSKVTKCPNLQNIQSYKITKDTKCPKLKMSNWWQSITSKIF